MKLRAWAWARARPVYAALLFTAAVVALAAAATSSARPGRSAPTPAPVVQEQTAYNGKWIWVRLRYHGGGGGGGFRRRGGDGWFHDYPDAERNITRLIANITAIRPGVEGGNIIDVGDPDLHRYPIAYLSEPGNNDRSSGAWDMDEKEVANLRSYLVKGGFLIVDDFPPQAWPNFEAQMKLMFPALEPIELDVSHPIFQTFFEVETLQNLHTSYMGQPTFWGYFEDNDPRKRMLVIANYMNDLGEKWEYAELGFSFLGDEGTSESYKFGVNYIVYGLTH